MRNLYDLTKCGLPVATARETGNLPPLPDGTLQIVASGKRRDRARWHRAAPLIVLLLALLASVRCVEAAEPRRVLLLQSYGSSFSPWINVVTTFREQLVAGSSEPIDIYDISLDVVRFPEQQADRPLVEYIRALFLGRKIDLVVPIGIAAMQFVSRQRSVLFSDTPALVLVFDSRRFLDTLTVADGTVHMRVEPAVFVENILRVRPETRNIAIVIGNTGEEAYWVSIMRRDFKQFEDRVSFTWLNELSVSEMAKHATKLPSTSAILYTFLLDDAARISYAQDSALEVIKAASSVPIFGVMDFHMGRGTVGGPLIQTKLLATEGADAALRILAGDNPSDVRVSLPATGVETYDWREMHKWGIQQSRLPESSTVQFREPSVWEQHRNSIAMAVFVVLLQATVITMLLLQMHRRRRAEVSLQRSEEQNMLAESRLQTSNQEFSKVIGKLGDRLVNLQENERKQIASELHDSTAQHLVAVDLYLMKLREIWKEDAQGGNKVLQQIQGLLNRALKELRVFTYLLYPPDLEQYGLKAAIEQLVEGFSDRTGISVEIDLSDEIDEAPHPVQRTALRIVQEALGNVHKHANASKVILVANALDGRLILHIKDNGRGMQDAADSAGRMPPGVGLTGMRDRVTQFGGNLQIIDDERGLSIVASIPID